MRPDDRHFQLLSPLLLPPPISHLTPQEPLIGRLRPLKSRRSDAVGVRLRLGGLHAPRQLLVGEAGGGLQQSHLGAKGGGGDGTGRDGSGR